MSPETSPFRPGQPAPVELFAGRRREIERLHGMVKASVQGRFGIGFISGERGIGKSSLVSFVRHLSEHDGSVAGCHVFLGGVQHLPEMFRRVFNRILKESMDRPWHGRVREFFGDHVRKVGLFGVTIELDIDDRDLSTIAHDFVPTVTRLLERIGDQKNALLLILDDINGLAGSDVFANWLKSMVDEISTSRLRVPVCILVVGLEDRRRELIERQPSLSRVFDLIDIGPWSSDEAREFYKNAFDSMNTRIADEDLDRMVLLAGGLPVFAHEIGDAVWRAADGPEIDSGAVDDGVLNAAEMIGRKHIEPRIFSAMRSERYRSILRRIMADGLKTHFRRAELAELLTGDERKVMDNFLQRMRRLGALESDPERQGGYRFPNLLHALYFWMDSRAR